VRVRHRDDNAAEEPRDQGRESLEGAPGRVSSALVSGHENVDDREMAKSLRPSSFDEYIGQNELISKLRIYVQAAKLRGEPLDHMLLHGPPGLGKTTLAMIIANEMGVRLHTTSAPAVEHKGILAALLTALGPNEVLFIDEIHRLSATVEESLYSAMEDGRIDLPMGEGSKATTMSIRLAPFTLVGATTRTALLSAPLRDRFHIIESLQFYDDESLAQIVSRSAKIFGVGLQSDAAIEIGQRSRGTPRIALRLTRRVRDFVQIAGLEAIESAKVGTYLAHLGVDDLGLDAIDRKILQTIDESFGGGPVGIEAVAASLGLPRDSLEDVHEPFLLQRGFLVRSPRGRMITPKAIAHLKRGESGE
jgi:Holliday junction DNA helicase RuvB